MSLQEEINRRRTFGIVSQPDAGKTTSTEQLFLFGDSIKEAESLKSNKINGNQQNSTKINETQQKSTKINENQQKSTNIHKNQQKSTNIHEHPQTSTQIHENQ